MRPWIFIIVMVTVSGALPGCRALQQGSEHRSMGEFVDDSMIVTNINTHTLRDQNLSFFDVSVESRRGDVVLYGNVTSPAAEKELVDFARGLKGVRSVQSRLIVIPAPVKP